MSRLAVLVVESEPVSEFLDLLLLPSDEFVSTSMPCSSGFPSMIGVCDAWAGAPQYAPRQGRWERGCRREADSTTTKWHRRRHSRPGRKRQERRVRSRAGIQKGPPWEQAGRCVLLIGSIYLQLVAAGATVVTSPCPGATGSELYGRVFCPLFGLCRECLRNGSHHKV